MADIKLKYNQGRTGIWSVSPIKAKEVKKDTAFSWAFHYLDEDYRRIVGRLMNHKKYKKFAVYNDDMRDDIFAVAWLFKVTSLGNNQSYIVRLQNSYSHMAKAYLVVEDKFRKKRKYSRLLTNTIPLAIRGMLKEDLKDVKPIEYIIMCRDGKHGNERGMAIHRNKRSGELVVRTISDGRNYDDGAVGDYWRF
jgi:hypothetical protein